MQRYAVIHHKNPREICLLRGRGCAWKRCTFCDYHLDGSPDEAANWQLNQGVLDQVKGIYRRLEVINSGSYPELDDQTKQAIEAVCRRCAIDELIVEIHWIYHQQVPALRAYWAQRGVRLVVKLGLETFDATYRRQTLCKGIPDVPLDQLREMADQICLLVGLPGQTLDSMKRDIEWGLTYFDRICINVMGDTQAPLKRDEQVADLFLTQLAPIYRHHPRIDLLEQNTDWGIGGA